MRSDPAPDWPPPVRQGRKPGPSWLVICEHELAQVEGASWVFCWNGYKEDEGSHSLLRYVERNAERLRGRYLAWIHELGETKINGRRIVDHLVLEGGLSVWWLTSLAEKSIYKSNLGDAIRLLAIDEIVRDLRPDGVRLVASDRNLHVAVRQLCERLDLKYQRKWTRGGTRGPARRWWRFLPYTLRGFGSVVRHVMIRWPLRKATSEAWFPGQNAIFLCSNFFHFSKDRAATGIFESGYWSGLLNRARKVGKKVNWLQIYYQHEAVPDARTARRLIKSINEGEVDVTLHQFLDSSISWRAGWDVLRRWILLIGRSWQLRGIEAAFCPLGSNVSLWPLMGSEWKDSLRGATAVRGLIYVSLFDDTLRRIPTQQRGFYVCENQAWERALVHAWRKYGHGRLIGVAHATVRFWDLRYFDDPRAVSDTGPNAMPQPDFMALNGEAAIKAYREAKFPPERIVPCEALRYNYLYQTQRTEPRQSVVTDSVRVLVLGDYLETPTRKMLQLLEEAAPDLRGNVEFTVKSHPNFPVHPDEFPRMDLRVTAQGLGELLPEFDLVYASNMTSASVDAYCAGLPVVVMLDDTELNFSPLRGWPGAEFVSDARSLGTAILTLTSTGGAIHPGRYFHLDPNLPRWSALLSS